MRYGAEHKERMRRRIVEVAGRLFRRHGYRGVGIDTIMSAAGLTRGGFYGYFRSKAALFAAVMAGEHDFTRRLQARPGRTRQALAAQALEVVTGYLHPENRRRVGQGCALASLSVDVARAGNPVRAAYGDKVRLLAAEFGRGLENAEATDPRALAAIALSVGGLMIARGVGDEALSQAILAACRDAATRELARPGGTEGRDDGA